MQKFYPCRVCGQTVEREAAVCPYCGAKEPADFLYNGTGMDYRSSIEIFGYPLIHIAYGKDRYGHLRVAKGIIAIGQFGIGLITFAQVGVGFLFGFGQLIVGLTAIAQAAITPLFGIGQFATGYVAIGQVVFGYYGLAQTGLAQYIWTKKHIDIEAFIFFNNLKDILLKFLK